MCMPWKVLLTCCFGLFVVFKGRENGLRCWKGFNVVMRGMLFKVKEWGWCVEMESLLGGC